LFLIDQSRQLVDPFMAQCGSYEDLVYGGEVLNDSQCLPWISRRKYENWNEEIL